MKKKILIIAMCAAAAWGGVWLSDLVLDKDARPDQPEEVPPRQPRREEQSGREKQPGQEDPPAPGRFEPILKRIDVLRAALAKNPNDLVSRKQLIITYLVDLDLPREAVKCLNPQIDPAMGKHVALAAKEASELAAADFLSLGKWYQSLASAEPLKDRKVRGLIRALDNTSRYLELYTKQDVPRLVATMLSASIKAELRQLGAGAATFPPGIVLALSFENAQWTRAADGSAVVKDSSGRAAGAALAGRVIRGTPGVLGKVGTGVTLPLGSRAYVGLPPEATAELKTFTFAFWVKTAESGMGRSYWMHPTLLGYNASGVGSRDFGITTNRGCIGYWSGLAVNSQHIYPHGSVRINDGAWHHIALTNDGNILLLYVDGTVVSPGGLPAGQALTTMQVPLGATRYDGRPNPTEAHHSGTYDELQLYNRALTVEEIAAIGRHERPSTIGQSSKAPAPAVANEPVNPKLNALEVPVKAP